MTTLRRIKLGFFGAAMAGALGFGASELVATTTAAPCANVPCQSGPNERACDACCAVFFPSPISDGFCGPEGECRCAV